MQKEYYYKQSLQTKLFFCFVYFIVLIKGLFVFFAVWNFYLKKRHHGSNDIVETKLEKNVSYYKNLTENIFIVLVSILLIYLFNPYHESHYLKSKYVKALFFIYGVLMLVTFDWSEFRRLR
jgi:hypothetical protein